MNLDDWRSRINDLDDQILDLLNQRAEAALQIGDLKRRQAVPPYAPEREADIVRRLIEQNPGPLAADAVAAVWREILSGCRALEAVLTVAYLGPQARFTHQAALPQGVGRRRVGPADHLGGEVLEGALAPAPAAELGRADAAGAAVAAELAARLYNVPLVRARIEDNPQNSTRFLVVGRRPVGPTGRDKTSILFAMKNVPGALYRILEPLARDGINLTKIESRPAKQSPWEYVIFVDLEGHRETQQISAVLREVGERTLFLKILGSYPAA